MIILDEGVKVSEFTVDYLIKKGEYCSSYRVSDRRRRPRYMKFFDFSATPEILKDGGEIREICVLKGLRNDALLREIAHGTEHIGGIEYHYVVTEFFDGQLLSEAISTGKHFSVDEAKSITLRILNALLYLKDKGLIHNDICPRNIILGRDKAGNIMPKLIDMGHTSAPVNGNPPFLENDLNPLYCAPETFSGVYSEKSDVFALSATMCTMLFGVAPWNVEFGLRMQYEEKKRLVVKAREEDLDFSDAPIDGAFMSILMLALHHKEGNRLSLDIFLKALNRGALMIWEIAPSKKREESPSDPAFEDPSEEEMVVQTHEIIEEEEEVQVKSNRGNGFADIAGMEELKKDLTDRVIWVLRDKEKSQRYKLTPPNGMLLYGPPGCGKTYFAQKFAEETGFNYMLINGSDIASTLVHGTQEKIAELFKKAEESGPTVLCFDEFDAFVPRRGVKGSEYQAEEVNEFLSQLNNCAQRGIFVIGTTNRKDMIDPAILRKGRIDLQFLIPAPDAQTRAAMLDYHLKGRPLDEDVDIDELVEATDNYSASDIAFIVNEAALMAALADVVISQKHLNNAIKFNPSSLDDSSRRKIGF